MAVCEYVRIPKIDLTEMHMKLKEFQEENEKLKQIIRMNNHKIIYGVNPESLPKDFSDKISIKNELREEIFKLSFQIKELKKEIENLKI